MLVQCGAPVPEGFADAQLIRVPIRSIAMLSTTHLPHLDVLDWLVAVSSYENVYSPAVRQLIATGKVAEVGRGPSVNLEAILDLRPDLVTAVGHDQPQYNTHPLLRNAGVNVAINAEYVESTLLGRSEWLKFTAAFLNRDGLAQRRFAEMAERYQDLPRRVEIMNLLRRLARETGRAVLLSTHDLDLALRGADQLWLLPPGGPLRAGIPEELVLEGAFQATFPSAEVAFDPYSGHFKLHNPACGHVDLAGEGLLAVWTGRALEREGFIVNGHGGSQSAVQVEVHDRCGQRIWRIRHAETCHEYSTLSQAIRGVKAQLAQLPSLSAE